MPQLQWIDQQLCLLTNLSGSLRYKIGAGYTQARFCIGVRVCHLLCCGQCVDKMCWQISHHVWVFQPNIHNSVLKTTLFGWSWPLHRTCVGQTSFNWLSRTFRLNIFHRLWREKFLHCSWVGAVASAPCWSTFRLCKWPCSLRCLWAESQRTS